MATATLAGGFTYANVSIDSITPSSGYTTGGEIVSIAGGGFNEYAIAYIGGNLLDNIVVASDHEITGTTPPGVAGNATVTVTQIDDSAQLVNGFEYITPLSITGVTPTYGSVDGGDNVTVTGTSFSESTIVSFNNITADNVVFIDSSSLTCDTPANAAGIVSVSVIDGITVTLDNAYEYIEPLTITSISPDADFDIGGKTVSVFGYGFDENTVITIGGNPLEDAQVLMIGFDASGNKIDSRSPLSVPSNLAPQYYVTGKVPNGIVGVQDVNADNSIYSYTATDFFTYIASVQLASITPTSGSFAGGVNVTIDGENFLSSAVVTVGNQPLTNQVVVDATTITGTIPQGSSGTANVIINQTSVAGLDSDILVNGFTYTIDPDGVVGPRAIKDTYQDILFLNGGLDADPNDVETQTGFVTPLQMSNDEVIITKPLTAVIEFTRD